MRTSLVKWVCIAVFFVFLFNPAFQSAGGMEVVAIVLAVVSFAASLTARNRPAKG